MLESGEIGMKRKSKQYNLWGRLRTSMRDVWRYSPSHKEAINKVKQKDPELGGYGFTCPLCKHDYPIQMAAVDHDPPLGSFDSWETFGDWTRRLFEGDVRVICKHICHKQVTAQQRKKLK